LAAFLRVVGFVAVTFLRFAFTLPLAFFLVAMWNLPEDSPE
jgi:hypothetical protein